MFSNQRIKVLQTIRQGQIGGGESHLLSLVQNLDKDKFEPVVLSFTDGPMVQRLREMGIKTHIIYTEKPFAITKWRKVKRFIAEHKIQLIHAHGTRATSNVFWAAKKLKIPLIYTIHGWSFHNDQNFFVKKIRLYAEKFLTSQSVVNISVSASNQRTGKDHVGYFRSIVITNGIDQSKFDPLLTFKNIRSELGLPEEVILILFIARFIQQKQPLKLVNAFSIASTQNKALRLLMVGDGSQKEEAIELVKKLGIEDKVIFLPFRQDVPDVLASADIFVLPSLWEGLPIGLLEAMAMGKAIIATRVDGTSEVLDGTNGVLLSLSNLEVELANAIKDLAGNQDLRKQLGEKARETIKDQYSAKIMTRKIEDIYLNLLGR